MFPMQAWSINETIKGALLVLKFSLRLTSFLPWAIIIWILGFFCASVWGSLNQPQDIFSFCEGEPFETSQGPEFKGNPSVSLKARQGVQWQMTGWCLRGVWETASVFPLKGRMRAKKLNSSKTEIDFSGGWTVHVLCGNFLMGQERSPSSKGSADLTRRAAEFLTGLNPQVIIRYAFSRCQWSSWDIAGISQCSVWCGGLWHDSLLTYI